MSMKFLTGLQDLLGLYDSSAGSSPQSPSSPIPPTNGIFPSPQQPPVSRNSTKKSAQELNNQQDDDSPVSRCSHDRSVHFDDSIVTGYSEAPLSPFAAAVNPTSSAADPSSGTADVGVQSVSAAPDPQLILSNYRRACNRARIDTSATVERQIGYMHHTSGVRQECLTLKGESVSLTMMDALEEIFRAVQFDSLDFEYTFLDDDALISLTEMLEFYDATHKLNLSFNRQVSARGWTILFRALRNCTSLQVLNLRYTSVERGFNNLCRFLRAQPPPALVCLHLENVALAGKNLLLLVGALKNNNTLKELYLGENCLQPADGHHLQQLIVSNTTLQMLDLRNNELGDIGLRHLCDGLRNPDACLGSALSAIVLWNNKITSTSMDALATVLLENPHVATLNIGSNHLGVTGVQQLRLALTRSTHLHRLGLQNTQINCEAAIILAECLADNEAMVRIDLRDNPGIGSAGLLALHSAMKMNSSITLMNLDYSCAEAVSERVRPYQDEFRRYFEEIRVMCDRNKQAALDRMVARADVLACENDGCPSDMVIVRKEDVVGADEDTAAACAACSVSPQTTGCSQPTTSSSTYSSSSSAANNISSCAGLSSSCSSLITVPGSSFESCGAGSDQPSVGKRIARSTSLTCTETVADITERIREMSGSTHSLDETNSESATTIKKSTTATYEPLGKAMWGSLPAIPQALVSASTSTTPTSDAAASSSPAVVPLVRKMRRFSVSPSSSTFDVNTSEPTSSLGRPPLLPGGSSARPSSLAIGIPLAGQSPPGPSSAPVFCSSLPTSLALWPEQQKLNADSRFSPVAEHAPPPSPLLVPSSVSPPAAIGMGDGGMVFVKKIDPAQQEKDKEEHLERERADREVAREVRTVVGDLVNYVVYEETSVAERKASILLGSAQFSAPDPQQLLLALQQELASSSTPITPSTPSRMMDIVEELPTAASDADDDELSVLMVVRQLVRDVLKQEKEQLRSTLERRRRKLNSVPGTPV